MSKDIHILLGHILESISIIHDTLGDLEYDAFVESVSTQDAVIRRLEIIGEAVKGIPESFRSEHPEIEWKKIAGMRDVLVHEYFSVDIELIWRVIKDELPNLEKSIRSFEKK